MYARTGGAMLVPACVEEGSRPTSRTMTRYSHNEKHSHNDTTVSAWYVCLILIRVSHNDTGAMHSDTSIPYRLILIHMAHIDAHVSE